MEICRLTFLWMAGAAACIAQNGPEFTEVRPLPNSEILMQLSSPTGFHYRLEVSTDLQNWIPLATLLGAGTNQHTDSGAPYLPARYYRAQRISDTNVIAGDHLVTADGEVVLRPVDHASFVMRWKDKMIYNDPVGGSTLYRNFPRADLILVSHTHSDHFNAGTLSSVRATNGVIIAPQAVYNHQTMTPALRSATIVLTNGASSNVLGLLIEAVPAYNSNHPQGTGNGYVVTIGGKRIYMSGDTGDIVEMRNLEAIDIAFVCMNVPFTMNLTQAVSAVREFAPKVIYPYHFRNQDGSLTDLNSFKQQVGRDRGVEVRARKWY